MICQTLLRSFLLEYLQMILIFSLPVNYNAKEVGFTMNEELELALKYYAINKLSVNLDEHLQWKPQIQHVNNKLAQNVGIIDKLRHYLDLPMLKQL